MKFSILAAFLTIFLHQALGCSSTTKNILKSPASLPPSASADEEWEAWKANFEKIYETPEEEASRRAIFEQNRDSFVQETRRSNFPQNSFTIGLNQFSDWSRDEQDSLLGFNAEQAENTNDNVPIFNENPFQSRALPSSIDWRPMLGPVKNQGKCGTCWAFSAIGSLEARWKQAGYTAELLSEQEVNDCTKAYGNNGCRGGWMAPVFSYAKDKVGVVTSSRYPYVAKDQTCWKNVTSPSTLRYAQVNQTAPFTKVNATYAALMSAIQQGPLSIAFTVNAAVFNYYKSGIYSGDSYCAKRSQNHAMLLVGYGRDASYAKDFWLVRNSWGDKWGESGYVRVLRTNDDIKYPFGVCQMYRNAVFPNVLPNTAG